MCKVKDYINSVGKEMELLLFGFQTNLAEAKYMERDNIGYKYLLQESPRTNSQFSDIQDRFYGNYLRKLGCYQVPETEVPKVELRPENLLTINKAVRKKEEDIKQIYLWLADEKSNKKTDSEARDKTGILKSGHILCVPPSVTQLAAEIYALEQVTSVSGELKEIVSDKVSNFKEKYALPKNIPEALQKLFKNEPLHLPDFTTKKLKASDFLLLTDENRPGNSEQRAFVENALSTKDFSIMIGPPGSGKTTTTVELILQLVKKEKRVLVVASTNVAIDNILEKLHEHMEYVSVKRYGNEDSDRISSGGKKFIEGSAFFKTECKELKSRLKKAIEKNPDTELASLQKELLENCDIKNNKELYEILQENVPVTVGTTFSAGIAEMKKIASSQNEEPPFDYLIIDEASKTTIQEFLVPAVLCKHWIIVGDIKQLPPYVDDDHLANNLKICYPEDTDKKKEYTALSDVLLSSKGNASKQVVLLIEKESELDAFYYRNYAKNWNVLFADADKESDKEILPYATIIVGSLKSFKENRDILSPRVTTIRFACDKNTGRILHEEELQEWVSIARYNREKYFKRFDENIPKEWHDEISWRLIRKFEQRENKVNVDQSTLERMKQEIKNLIPCWDFDNCEKNLHIFEQIYLPSFMELLLQGFGEYKSMALLCGLPKEQLEKRCTELTYQHRCHKDIAEIASEEFYDGKAMRSEHMVGKRNWDYKRFPHANCWQDIRGRCDFKTRNQKELNWIKQELEKFNAFSLKSQKKRSVAALSFYKEQGEALKEICRKIFANNKNVEYSAGSVDAFQGHEADIVFLSYANQYPTCFISAPNRYNVAITRARYQMVHVGNFMAMCKSEGALGRIVQKLKNFKQSK